MQNLFYSKRAKIYFIALVFFFLNNQLHSQPGTLDLSYGRGGIVTTGIITEITWGLGIQIDGKIVTGGYNSVNGDIVSSEYCLSRFTQNGNIDTTFGYRGIVHTTFPGTFAKGFDLVIQPDSKIILAGQNYSEYALARYQTDGSLDSTFGLNGLVSVDVGGHPDEVRSVLLQPDGKILVSGQSRVNLMRDLSIARFESDGSFDLSFGNQGKVIVSIGTTGDEYCEEMVLQPDGRIIIAGTYYNGTDRDFVAVRFNIDGSLDSTFGNAGIKTLQISNTNDYCKTVVVQSDGKIVLGGFTEYMVDSTKSTLARLLPDGSLDSLFGNGGIAHPINTTFDFVTKIILDNYERIIVSNYASTFRCLNNGSLDLSYGNGGMLIHPLGKIVTLTMLSDSKIIHVGSQFDPWNENIYISKSDSTGVLDSTFGVNGESVYDDGIPFNLESYDMLIANDDKTVMMGYYSGYVGQEGVFLARYDSIGHLDRTFGVEGISLINTDAKMRAFKKQSDGKYIAGGKSDQNCYGLMRFSSNGLLDSTFGVNGSISTPQLLIYSNYVGINSLVLQADEKIIVSGYLIGGIATVRYLPDGTLDSSFAGDGIVIDNFNGTMSQCHDLKIQYDGKLVGAGGFFLPGNFIMGIFRYNTDGTPDMGFGVNGKVEITHPDGIMANDLFFLPDHKILITGSTLLANNDEIVLLKLNEDGSQDTTFASGGVVITSLSAFDDNGAVVLIQSDGKIIIGANSDYGIKLLRYNSDGTLDSAFGVGGVATIFINLDEICNSVAFQSDGKIMVGGNLDKSTYSFSLLARFDSSGVLSSINEMPIVQNTTNQLAPNPSNGDFNLLNAIHATIDIEIYSTNGKLVFKKLKHPSTQTLATNLPSGMYHVKVVDGMHQGVYKVVVVR